MISSVWNVKEEEEGKEEGRKRNRKFELTDTENRYVTGVVEWGSYIFF